jgi:hypothetical protein
MLFKGRWLIGAGAAVVVTLMAIITSLRRDWIEVAIRIDPDGGSGSLEWVMVGALALALVAVVCLARRWQYAARQRGRLIGNPLQV